MSRVANCQMRVTTHDVDRAFDWPVNARLYLPRDGAEDSERREQAQVPEVVPFRDAEAVVSDLGDPEPPLYRWLGLAAEGLDLGRSGPCNAGRVPDQGAAGIGLAGDRLVSGCLGRPGQGIHGSAYLPQRSPGWPRLSPAGEPKYDCAWSLGELPLLERAALIHVRWAIERLTR